MTQPRLAVLEFHHLGDLAIAAPFLTAAAANYEVHLFCRKPSAPLAAKLLPSAHVHICEPPWHEESDKPTMVGAIKSYFTLVRQIAAIHPKATVCAWADPRVHWLMRLARVKKRIGFPVTQVNFYGYDFPARRKIYRLGLNAELPDALPLPFLGKSALTHKLHRASATSPHTSNWQLILDALQVVLAGDLRCAPATKPLPADLAAWMERRATAGDRVVLVHPGARLPSKRWREIQFMALMREPHWAELGVHFLVIDPPDGPVLPCNSDRQFLWRPRSLDELVDATASVDAVLTNDSLQAHLAAASGTPVRSIFCTGNPHWFAPGGSLRNCVFREPLGAIPIADQDDQPCYVHPDGPTIAQVHDALTDALSDDT